jgi:hypothetical protein
VGAVGAAALLGLYLGIITIAQGADHAVEQLGMDWMFVLPLALGFGIQLALLAELRSVGAQHHGDAALTTTSTGMSTAAMLACCAHHLVDLLPLLGLSAAAVFLDAFKTPLLALGLALNAIAIVVIARRLAASRHACHRLTTPAPAGATTF